MIEAVVFAGGTFLVFLLVHALIFYIHTPINRWRVVQRLAIVFLLIYVVVYYALPSSNWFGILASPNGFPKIIACANGALMYIFLFLTYGQVYFLVDRGVSARMMVEILATNDMGLTQEEIAMRYSPSALERRRLDDMRYGHYVFIKDGRYHLTTKGKAMGYAFLALKRLLRLYPGG